jgi:hypothetical protein
MTTTRIKARTARRSITAAARHTPYAAGSLVPQNTMMATIPSAAQRKTRAHLRPGVRVRPSSCRRTGTLPASTDGSAGPRGRGPWDPCIVLYPKKRCIVRVSCLQNGHAEQTTLRDERPREDIPYHKERPAGSDKAHYGAHEKVEGSGKPWLSLLSTSAYQGARECYRAGLV